jgi:predicted glutamine amidotransferase
LLEPEHGLIVQSYAPRRQAHGRMNADGDGRRIIATRWNDTLSILHTRGGVVASEPYYDDPGWADVPGHHLVDVADGVVTVTELEA